MPLCLLFLCIIIFVTPVWFHASKILPFILLRSFSLCDSSPIPSSSHLLKGSDWHRALGCRLLVYYEHPSKSNPCFIRLPKYLGVLSVLTSYRELNGEVGIICRRIYYNKWVWWRKHILYIVSTYGFFTFSFYVLEIFNGTPALLWKATPSHPLSANCPVGSIISSGHEDVERGHRK